MVMAKKKWQNLDIQEQYDYLAAPLAKQFNLKNKPAKYLYNQALYQFLKLHSEALLASMILTSKNGSWIKPTQTAKAANEYKKLKYNLVNIEVSEGFEKKIPEFHYKDIIAAFVDPLRNDGFGVTDSTSILKIAITTLLIAEWEFFKEVLRKTIEEINNLN